LATAAEKTVPNTPFHLLGGHDTFQAIVDRFSARYGFPEEHLPAFLHWLEVFSGWMVNRRSPKNPAPHSPNHDVGDKK